MTFKSNFSMRSILTLFAAIATTGCASMNSASAPGELIREPVIENLKSPWGMAFISADEVLITEKEGGLVLADLRTGDRTMIAGLPDDLVDDIRKEVRFDNSGLFDVALDPNFDTQPWVYLSYSAKTERGLTTKIIRAKLSNGVLRDMETLLVAEPYTIGEYFHFGGGLAFGADGKLYVTIGERLYNERDNPDHPIAQDKTDRRGKIYRLNPDGSPPADNPAFGDGAVPGLFAVGVRAAQGIALNDVTGEIWFSEHGSRQGDEINRLVAGANYGWPVVTDGGYRNEDYTPPDLGDVAFTQPVWSWAQTVAPTGLVFYSGTEFPEWEGDLFVSGLSRGSLWRLNFEGGRIVSVEDLFVHERVRSRDIAVAPDGALYMLTDTLLAPNGAGGLDYTGTPNGQLLRLMRRSQ